ncbi:hypothetical protein GHT07_09540 [Caenimonas koreensis DSM 17982]|uniref:Uncharacterized protein n=1 Tax=Caenimonas koreensis DSM 17982 TaxID=1121255 RepID=A0A844AST3_9BURK|nr:hypothetical protein [Caenimonas koreensis]MRD47520.1 hypothetical protein [Caenimonas koreensis DSM 17982]
MILEDKLVQTRLQKEPEFLLRLHEILTNWKVGEKPGLVVQARPVQAASLEVLDVKVRNALREGIDSDGNGNLWDHFEAIRMFHSLHGITATANTESPIWLTEAHRDGHMIAGVWDFPDLPAQDGQNAKAMAYWYESFFGESFKLMSNVAAAGGLTGEFQATATLANANMLRYGARSPANRPMLAGEPCLMPYAQWSLQKASIEKPEWHMLARSMAQGIAGAFRAPIR